MNDVGTVDPNEATAFRLLQLFSQLQLWRNTFAAQWEEVASLILPTSRNTFYYGNFNWPGQKRTEFQVDASGMVALSRFSAICDSLLTPRNMTWHGLEANNPDVQKDRDVRIWMEKVTRILFKYRYAAIGNFAAQNQANYQSLGAFGTNGMFIDQAVTATGAPMRAIRYKAVPLGELFLMENHQGLVNGFVRWFRLTAEQAFQKWGDKIPETLQAARSTYSQSPFDFLHVVEPRMDFDPQRMDEKGKPFASYYLSVEGRKILSEGGYRTFPLAVGRYEQAPGEVYGRGPAMMCLPSLKTLNAQKRTFLKQGHRAADPVLLTSDDGLIDVSLRPGAMNKGGMSSDGKPLVGVLPTGSIQTNKEMMDEERSLVNDMFLVSLFQILTETPTMSATEVVERTNEKGILIAPTVGRQSSEYLSPMIERELDLLADLRLLPPMPPLLREAHGEYEITATSPLARMMRAQEAAGFMRTVESVKEIVNITQDPSLLDTFDFDTAVPAIAEIQSVPESWMSDPKAVAKKRDDRAKAQAQQQKIQAAPAAAALMKAQVAASQAPQQGPPQAPPPPGGPGPGGGPPQLGPQQ